MEIAIAHLFLLPYTCDMDIDIRLYPIVIRQSRYGGTYEGGSWHAIGSWDDENISNNYMDYVFGDDGSAVDFWMDSDESKLIGIGNTPNEAYEDLLKKNMEPISE